MSMLSGSRAEVAIQTGSHIVRLDVSAVELRGGAVKTRSGATKW